MCLASLSVHTCNSRKSQDWVLLGSPLDSLKGGLYRVEGLGYEKRGIPVTPIIYSFVVVPTNKG